MVDGEKRFLDVVVGFLGSMYDFRVLRNSLFYRRIVNNELFLGLIVRVDGRDIILVLFGDSVYFLFIWLLKFYYEGINECVFGILEGRWRIF